MAERHNLAILSLISRDNGDHTDLIGLTSDGTPAGKVVLRDRPYSIAVSPDANGLAWDNWSARAKPDGGGSALRVKVATSQGALISLPFDPWFGGPLAVSSNGEHVVLVRGVIRPKPSFELIIADGNTGRVEQDLTGLITKFSLPQVIRIAISGSGDRLVVGSSEWFTVIDPKSRNPVVYEAPGRDVSLSPNGQFLAFVDEENRAILVDLSTRSHRTLLERSRKVSGIGAWSPDGQYLLAGLEGWLSRRLVAIEAKTNQVIDMMTLGDVGGSKCVWVNKGFLSSALPL